MKRLVSKQALLPVVCTTTGERNTLYRIFTYTIKCAITSTVYCAYSMVSYDYILLQPKVTTQILW